jgi:RNA polymerase sigma-70 factor, ECF subfamily
MTPDFLLLYLAVSGSTGLNDRDLARRIRNGDLEAFRQFFEEHKALLAGFLRKRQVPDDVAGDIIQNAFITIWERRSEIDENKSLRAYLFRISYTRALNHFRDTAKFTGSHLHDDSPLLHIPKSDQAGPEQQADHAIIRDALDRIIAGMPEKRRAVLSSASSGTHLPRGGRGSGCEHKNGGEPHGTGPENGEGRHGEIPLIRFSQKPGQVFQNIRRHFFEIVGRFPAPVGPGFGIVNTVGP